ncbi:uncharacterized protein LOC113751143 [Coffea eugenioides]|uniref:PB1 domain-containing protein n=1 Tax=Coffea arabica TaxID=13443 RepID=A0A6P6VCR7_COFAR|nr:uncharacterized protein LOC113719452 [Coffea arabica]XP_027150824.1 uncharacterized protein LOC113751143 [Coffea eugenioides]
MVGPSMLNTYKYNVTLKSSPTTIKFLCSYGGKILPRYPDGKLRYHGGETRVLAVERSISFSELVMKLGEMCGASVSLRCQLPTEDMDALVSITSDEDLANLIEEYDLAAVSASPTTNNALKIRAFLSTPYKPTTKKSSPSHSIASFSTSSNEATSPVYSPAPAASPSLISFRRPIKSAATDRCVHQIMSRPAVAYPHPLMTYEKAAAKGLPHHQYVYCGPGKASSHVYLIQHGNHWQ